MLAVLAVLLETMTAIVAAVLFSQQLHLLAVVAAEQILLGVVSLEVLVVVPRLILAQAAQVIHLIQLQIKEMLVLMVRLLIAAVAVAVQEVLVVQALIHLDKLAELVAQEQRRA